MCVCVAVCLCCFPPLHLPPTFYHTPHTPTMTVNRIKSIYVSQTVWHSRARAFPPVFQGGTLTCGHEDTLPGGEPCRSFLYAYLCLLRQHALVVLPTNRHFVVAGFFVWADGTNNTFGLGMMFQHGRQNIVYLPTFRLFSFPNPAYLSLYL